MTTPIAAISRKWPVYGISILLFWQILSCSPTTEMTTISFIDPPIPGLEKSYTLYQIDADQGGEIEHFSGTRIFIPACGLVREDGSRVSGNVMVKYREYHDDVDIFLSGIPMHYDTAGSVKNLQSAGMFDLEITQNDQPLLLDSMHRAEVKMASHQPEEDYNFYWLDEENEGWAYLGTNKPEVNKEKETIRKKIRLLKETRKHPLGKKYFAFNYDAVLDIYLNNDWKKIRQERGKDRVKRKAMAYGLSWSEIYNRKMITFRGNQHLAAMMVWKKHSRRPFPKWAKRTLPINLKKVRGNLYEMTLYDSKSESYHKTHIEAIMPLKTLFAFSPEYWENNYAEAMVQMAAEEERLKMEAEVFRTFQINQFGIYNWDRYLKQDNKILVNGHFDFDTLLNDKLNDPMVYYLTGARAVIKLPRDDWDMISLLPDSTGCFIAVLPDKKVARFSRERYRQLDFEGLGKQVRPDYTFDMEQVSTAINSAGDLKAILGI